MSKGIANRKLEYVCKDCDTTFTASKFIDSKKRQCKLCNAAAAKARKSKTSTNKLSKPVIKKLANIANSNEWGWLIGNCRRAGTVQILEGQTAKGLERLFAVYSTHAECYGYSSKEQKNYYSICHIAPVKGSDSTGLLNDLNLFIGRSKYNEEQGSKSFTDTGLSIANSKLKPRFKVADGESTASIIDKIKRILGKALITYAKTNPIRLNDKPNTIKWILNNIDDAPPLEILESLYLRDLRNIKEEVTGGGGGFGSKNKQKRSLLIAYQECQRLAGHLPTSQHKTDLFFLLPYLHLVCAWMATEERGFSDVLIRTDDLNYTPILLNAGYDTSKVRHYFNKLAFETLQGKTLDHALLRNTAKKYFTCKDFYFDPVAKPTQYIPDWLAAANAERELVHQDQVIMIQQSIIKAGLNYWTPESTTTPAILDDGFGYGDFLYQVEGSTYEEEYEFL